MRANVPASTCKSSKQTQHVSASLCGCAGLVVDDDPAEEDDDFEVDLDTVDDVSFALTVVSSGFKVLASESMSFGNSCARGGATSFRNSVCPLFQVEGAERLLF